MGRATAGQLILAPPGVGGGVTSGPASTGQVPAGSTVADLAEAVRVVARGEALLAPTVTRRLLDRFADRLPGAAASSRELAALTAREVEVLTLTARALSNAEIAERLYLSTATVKTHVSAILTKLGLRDRVQAVVFAYEVGLIRPEPPAR